MKHFEITYYALNTPLTYACTTIKEATDALCNIITIDPKAFSGNIDELIHILVNMKYGCHLKHTQNRLSIKYVEGEV